jgi:hypothetical protein
MFWKRTKCSRIGVERRETFLKKTALRIHSQIAPTKIKWQLSELIDKLWESIYLFIAISLSPKNDLSFVLLFIFGHMSHALRAKSYLLATKIVKPITFNDIFIFLLREVSHVDFVHEKRHMDILESSTKAYKIYKLQHFRKCIYILIKSICNCMSIIGSWSNGLADNSEIRVLNVVYFYTQHSILKSAR